MPLDAEHERALEAFHAELDDLVRPVVQTLFDSYETNTISSDASGDETRDAAAAARMSVASAGFLINRPGSRAQEWHRDGPNPGYIDAFVPLVDVTAELGPTEVRIGTHFHGGGNAESDQPSGVDGVPERRWDDGMPYSVAPTLRKGEVLLLDYTTLHRGLGNSSPSATRPMAYAVYRHETEGMFEGGGGGTATTIGDVRNFPAATTLEYD